MTVERTVAIYPSDTRSWVGHLARLAQELRGSRLDASEVVRALNLVYAAAATRELGDHRADPW